MSGQTNEQVVRRYTRLMVDQDYATAATLRHPEWRMDWPQSGERITSSEGYRLIHENYPGGLPHGDMDEIVGAEDRYVVTPLYTIERIVGGGNFWFGYGHLTYPDGARWMLAWLIEMRDQMVYRDIQFWAEAFDAPEWRSQWVERMPAPRERGA